MSYLIRQAEREVATNYGKRVSAYQKGKSLRKFGSNDAVGTDWETVGQFQNGTGNETYVSTNIIDAVVSTNAGDTQTLHLEGHTIDGSGNLTFVVQEVTLSGQTPVAIPTPLARATRSFVKDSGTFNSPQTAPVGVVSFYDDTDGATAGVPNTDAAVKLLIKAGDVNTEKCATSVSANDFWFVTGVAANVGPAGGNAARVELRLEARDVANGGVFRRFGSPIVINIGAPKPAVSIEPLIIIPSNHDVRLVARCNANTAQVFGEIDGYLANIVS